MFKLIQVTSSQIITELDTLQSYYRKCRKIVSNNGSNLSSSLINNYCLSNGIDHQQSSPYHPEGNLIAELAVKKSKSALCRALLTTQSTDDLLRASQSLWLSDCQVSAQE